MILIPIVRDTSSPANWASFVKAGRDLFDENRGCPAYELIDSVDQIYRLAQPKFPIRDKDPEEQLLLPMCFMLSHKSFLGAATVAASGQPEDSPAITRRALEAANLCLAVHIEPANFQRWRNTQERIQRWKKRLANEKPKNFSPHYKGVDNNALYNSIKDAIALLSDASVHFTPEHLLGYEFKQFYHLHSKTTSFGVKEKRLVIELLSTVDFHCAILRAFDYCSGNALKADPNMETPSARAWTLFNELLMRERGIDENSSVTGTWWSPEG